MSDRRVVLESVAFGSDPKITPGDRLRALDGLRELEVVNPVTDDLSEEQIWAEADSWHAMMLGAMFVASGPDLELDPAQFPRTAQALRMVVGRMIERAPDAGVTAGEWDVEGGCSAQSASPAC